MYKQVQNGKIIIKISIAWLLVAIILIVCIVAFFNQNIFATNTEIEEEQKTSVAAFEENQKSVDILELMVENTSENKKLVNEERDVQFETTYEENPNLPKDEQQVKQEGKVGKVKVTALQSYQTNEFVEEEIIESITMEEVVPNIIYVGTSQFLSDYKVHIGDQMYLLEAEDLKEAADDTSNTICNIPRYLNVTLQEIVAGEEWVKVKYNSNEGYIRVRNITSEAVTPLITEKNRVATLKANLTMETDLSLPSGLTLSDYKTAFSNNPQDKDKIFENNVQVFYDVEQKYKINGIFLAAIGIHESAWGTSTLAKEKFNLFGFQAYDRDPYNSAKSFESYENSINTVAEALSKNYLHIYGTNISDGIVATGTYFNGTTIKSVNMRYASDENWSNKIFSYMQYLYNKL